MPTASLWIDLVEGNQLKESTGRQISQIGSAQSRFPSESRAQPVLDFPEFRPIIEEVYDD